MANLANIKRGSVESVIKDLKADAVSDSRAAGERLVSRARDAGLSMRDYLTLAVDVRATEDDNTKTQAMTAGLDGYELTKLALNLPVADDYKHGVLLQAASDTFQMHPGTRILFPEVVDDMVQFRYKQDQFERVDPMLVQSRTINGAEVLSYVVDDKAADYDVAGAIPEGSNIPVSSIRTSSHTVGIFKHGMGYRTTYEFERRASLDILTPYANRAQRAMELSRVKFATSLLINGDAVHGAATQVNQSSYNTAVGENSVNGKLSYKHLLRWLVARAKAGTPIDTVVGNWDAYVEWLMLFALPAANTSNAPTSAEALARTGFTIGAVPLLSGAVNFVLSSNAPANVLIGFSRGDTLEELVEAGSLINESERSVSNQTISYYRTMNTGYRLVHGDTRSVFNFGA
jgi:hypothetical protein